MASTTTTTFLTFALLFLLATTTTTATAIAPTTAPITPHHHAQENTIIDAIIGATDFSNWANLLAAGDTSATAVPLSATLFLPDNLNNNNLPLASHVIPRRLTFSDLQLFPTGAHLPTLIPGTTLRITNNSAVNFTINASKLTKPDIYQNAVVSVHGVDGFLDGSSHGVGLNVSGVGSRRRLRQSRSPKPPTVEVRPLPPAAVSDAVKGTTSCSREDVAVVALLVMLVLHVLGFQVSRLSVVLVIVLILTIRKDISWEDVAVVALLVMLVLRILGFQVSRLNVVLVIVIFSIRKGISGISSGVLGISSSKE